MQPALASPIVDRRAVISLFSRLRTASGQANPLPVYAELRSMGDVVPAPWGGYLITSYGLCDQVLRDKAWQVPDSAWRARQGDGTRWGARSSREMSRTMPALNGAQHTRVRRSVGNMFDRKTLPLLKISIGKTVEELLDRLTVELRNGEADFSAIVSEELPMSAIGGWLHLPSADYPLLRSLAHDQVFTQELLPSASQLARSDAATDQLEAYFRALVQERRRSPGDDPVSHWLRTWDELESDREAADEAVYLLALLVFLAAPETTSALLSTMMWLLLEHPLQMGWLRAHPQHIPEAVEEVLRYDSPNHVISRIAPADTTLAGVPIEKDRMVHLMVGAANHDPAHHIDPHIFDVRRKAGHLSFSGGIHYCLGAQLARLEATTLLTGVLRRLPGLSVSAAPVWAPRVGFRRIMELRITAS
ncbi:cytochrome P450 [Streptomyces halobius]|uniref:Cytochrome P450 n=1 Tax=Streptomyces halobius TaxID=2879846 RepID=A0ABY4M3T1_9ACTN|nr:cytochrome P450 [Streptomyces halobius]UQA91015.1 cytochrome P450 [Streptomyces halobius]